MFGFRNVAYENGKGLVLFQNCILIFLNGHLAYNTLSYMNNFSLECFSLRVYGWDLGTPFHFHMYKPTQRNRLNFLYHNNKRCLMRKLPESVKSKVHMHMPQRFRRQSEIWLFFSDVYQCSLS